jgi:hypothetical protein
MNTLLLPTNTTNCSTKNLRKIAAVICMTAVFVFTNISVFAQGFSNSEGKTAIEQEAAKQKWVEEHRDELNKTVNPAVVKPAPVAKEVAPAKEVVVKTQTPAVATKQAVTTQSAETIDNAVVVPASSVKQIDNVNTPAVRVNKSVEARNNRPSAVDQLPVVKPYDKSTVVNEVNKEVKYPQIPGFVATGNADADAKAFEVAKTNLQQSNPAEYSKFFSEKE